MSSENSERFVLLNHLADEFAERYRRGEQPLLQEYIDRHPDLADDIRELFPALVEMEQVKEQRREVSEPAATGPLPAMERLGDFRILREIGHGGMGVVYEAEQVSLGRRVALKVLPRQLLVDARAKQRFEREARAAAKLHHTNIVPVFGVGEHEGLPYYAMQFIPGLGLDEVLDELRHTQQSSRGEAGASAPAELRVSRKDISAADVARSLLTGAFQPVGDGPDVPAEGRTVDQVPGPESESATNRSRPPTGRLSDTFGLSGTSEGLRGSSDRVSKSRVRKHTYWRSVGQIGVQIADALEHAHKQGIIHRDVKPSNLLLDTHGTVWVMDFGLAKADDHQDLTHTGDVLGTLRYMSPEAFEGRADSRSDLYSLGLTLYELLALRPAFDETDRNKLLKQVTGEEPVRLDRLNRDIPLDLVTVVHKVIDRDPARRYQTAADLGADLERFLNDQPIRARRVGAGERAWRWCKRNPAVASLLAALAFTLTAGLLGVAWKWREAEHNLRVAEDNAGQLAQALTQAEVNFDMSREAVDHYLTSVSESDDLKEPALTPLRKQLLETAREFYQKFADERKDDPRSRAGLAWAYLRLGAVHGDGEGDFARALQRVAQAREMLEQLSTEQPDIPSHRALLAQAAKDEAIYHGELGRPAQAEAALRRAIDLQEQVVRETGADGDRTQLAGYYQRLALTIQGAGRPADVAVCRREAALRERLAGDLPSDPQRRCDLGWSLNSLCTMLVAAGRPAEAEAVARRSLALFERLSGEHPGRPEFAADRGAAYSFLARAFEARGEWDEARRLYEQGIALIRAALQKTNTAYIRRNLTIACQDLARANLALHRHAEAARAAVDLAQARPGNTADKLAAVRLLSRCAALAREDPRLAEAARRRAAEEYLESAGPLIQNLRVTSGGPQQLHHLASLLANFPLGEFRDPAWAIVLARRATARSPENGDYWTTLGLAQYRAEEFLAAKASLEKARALHRKDEAGRVRDELILSMVLWHLDDGQAPSLFRQAAAAAEKYAAKDDDLRRLRDEAAEVLAAPAAGRTAAAGRTWMVLHDAQEPAMRAWLQRMQEADFIPVFVHAHGRPGGPRFSALAVNRPANQRRAGWQVHFDKGFNGFQRRFEEMAAKRYWVSSLSGYVSDGVSSFVSLWVLGAPPVWCRHAATGDFVRREAERRKAAGARMVSLSSYLTPEGILYTTVYGPDQGLDWGLRLDLTQAEYEAALTEARAKGRRPSAVAVSSRDGQPRFAAVLLQNVPALKWEERHGLSAAEFAREHERQTAAGFRPEQVVGYEQNGESRYLAVWVQARAAAPRPIPMTGERVPELAGFDAVMRKFMAERSIPAGSLAVMKNGQLLLAHGYGFLDREGQRPVIPDTPFRLASLTKPITAAAIHKLVREGKLSPDDRVVPLQGLTPPAGKEMDPRWQEITVRHLIQHQGGWDRNKAGDPMFQSRIISEALKIPGPPSPTDVVRYLVGQPLQFDPGRKSTYSNFGYCLLGRVIEKVSGVGYETYVRRQVLRPIGVAGIKLGRTLPGDRDPREPFYSDPRRGQDVVHGEGLVPSPDGSFHLEAMDAHGGLIGPAPDLVRFLDAYRLDGTPAIGKPSPGAFFGSLPGSFTLLLQRPDGVQIAALFNQRNDPTGLDYFEIRTLLDQAADAVPAWPAR